MQRFSPRLSALLALTLLALFAPAARTQAPQARPGDQVRLSPASGGRVRGTLVRSDADSVVIRPHVAASADAPVAYPLAALSRVDVMHGRSRHPVRGALIGMGAGVVLGNLAVSLGKCTGGDCSTIDGTAHAAMTLAGALIGGGVGALVGYHGHARWQRVGGATTVSFAQSGAVGVGMTMRTR